MATTTTVPLTFGDSLRALADIVDGAPSLHPQSLYPEQPARLSVVASTGAQVETLATLLGGDLDTLVDPDGASAQTHMTLRVGSVALNVFAIEPVERELHRPVDVHEPHEDLEPGSEVTS